MSAPTEGELAQAGLHPNARQIIAHAIARHWATLLPDLDGRPTEFELNTTDKVLAALVAASKGTVLP
jgi:hypothetical protein